MIRVIVDPVGGNLTERGAGDEQDYREECKDGVGLDGVRPHEWSLETNCRLNLSVSILELYPDVRCEYESKNERKESPELPGADVQNLPQVKKLAKLLPII